MAVKKQHYVPRVYLKKWEIRVSNRKEPNKYFDGIYYFNKNNLLVGDGRNILSILWKPHIYTIKYEDSFIIKSFPKAQDDYIKQVMVKLKEHNVSAFFNGIKLKSKRAIKNNFLNLENWEFEYNFYPFNKAKKAAVINDIKSINSYVIEHGLDNVIETKWESCLNEFINQIENTTLINSNGSIRQIDEKLVTEIIRMIIFLVCRNPDFDYWGNFKIIKEIFFNYLFWELDDNDRSAFKRFTDTEMKAFWLSEIYKGLFNVNKGFCYISNETIKKHCQVIVYKCLENEGTFITSDNPAFFNNLAVTWKNLKSIICPLTPQYLILVLRGDYDKLNSVRFEYADNDLIRKFNTIIFNHSKESIISSYKFLGKII